MQRDTKDHNNNRRKELNMGTASLKPMRYRYVSGCLAVGPSKRHKKQWRVIGKEGKYDTRKGRVQKQKV
ncbi:MAG: hypothetical protein FWD31_10445 [Planctomycetaceae bacterium]|nr:hypothetical protein [Planctomycetaceae bacterium]